MENIFHISIIFFVAPIFILYLMIKSGENIANNKPNPNTSKWYRLHYKKVLYVFNIFGGLFFYWLTMILFYFYLIEKQL